MNSPEYQQALAMAREIGRLSVELDREREYLGKMRRALEPLRRVWRIEHAAIPEPAESDLIEWAIRRAGL